MICGGVAAWAGLPLTSGANGTIRGRVQLRDVPPPVVARPDVTALAFRGERRSIDRRRSVVYLQTAPRAAFEDSSDARAAIDQRNQTFVPRLLAVTAGTTVDFPNNDRTYHNVFSLSKAKAFDLGRYAAGRSKAVRFDRPGIVRVFCDIHSHMSAHVLVFGHRFFAITDEQGQYRIDNVPPGTYTVIAWHEVLDEQARPVVVPDLGGDVDASFSLGR